MNKYIGIHLYLCIYIYMYIYIFKILVYMFRGVRGVRKWSDCSSIGTCSGCSNIVSGCSHSPTHCATSKHSPQTQPPEHMSFCSRIPGPYLIARNMFFSKKLTFASIPIDTIYAYSFTFCLFIFYSIVS